MIVWCEPMKRETPKLGPGDIADALAWFREKTGHEAQLAILNPQNERYAQEVGDNLKVEYTGGCLVWEVWLSAEDGSATVLSQPHDAPESKIGCDKKENHTNAPVGRNPLDLPLKRIQDLAAQGLSSRVIASKLQAEGISVSYQSILRAIKKLQGELPMFSL